LDHIKTPVPDELIREFKATLDDPIRAIFGMYRVNRNEAGHPTGKKLGPAEVRSNLDLFQYYIQKINKLIDWLKANKLP
jgi:hypothetical protein